jgi:hypothetical protein
MVISLQDLTVSRGLKIWQSTSRNLHYYERHSGSTVGLTASQLRIEPFPCDCSGNKNQIKRPLPELGCWTRGLWNT